jgi:hypothetical protein
VLDDLRVGEFAPNCFQRGERPLLVRAHQPRIAGDIGGENGRQATFDPLFAHLIAYPERMCLF